MKITFFGGVGEVGRSCKMVSTPNTNIQLDSGVKLGQHEEHPQISRDQINSVDGIFISHAHLDHTGYLPHIFSHGYKGHVYSTKPTMELTNVLISDYLRISNPRDVTKKGVEELSRHWKIIDYKKEFKFRDLTIRFNQAGHILGSALTEVSDGRSRIAYTGDINLSKTRLLEGADTRNLAADTLITESTYGAKHDVFPSEKKTSQGMLKSIKDTIQQGGKVIVPSFAVGRAQEVLFLLDDHINSGILPKVPVYVDGMINKAMRIHRHNVIYCRKELQSKILMSDYDPFKSPNFVPVEKKSMRGKIVSEDEASIIVTTSGMLTGGPVMYYLSRMAKNPANKLMLVGYQAIGTMGRAVQDGARSVFMEGREMKIEMDVETYHLSAHADRPQLEMLINRTKGLENVFILHGEINKSKELEEFAANRFKAHVPRMKDEYDI